MLVAIAAALWGTGRLDPAPLAQSTDVATIVFGEHLVLVALHAAVLVPARSPRVLRLGWRYVLAAVVIGAGSSAVATILFTQAFVVGDRLRDAGRAAEGAADRRGGRRRDHPRRAACVRASRSISCPALVGAWLIGVPHPLHPTVHGAEAGALRARRGRALGARHGARPLPRAR